MRRETLPRIEAIGEIDAPPLSEGILRVWSYFIRRICETDSLAYPKCQGEMRIVSFIDQPDVLALWEKSQPL